MGSKQKKGEREDRLREGKGEGRGVVEVGGDKKEKGE